MLTILSITKFDDEWASEPTKCWYCGKPYYLCRGHY